MWQDRVSTDIKDRQSGAEVSVLDNKAYKKDKARNTI